MADPGWYLLAVFANRWLNVHVIYQTIIDFRYDETKMPLPFEKYFHKIDLHFFEFARGVNTNICVENYLETNEEWKTSFHNFSLFFKIYEEFWYFNEECRLQHLSKKIQKKLVYLNEW